MSRVITKCFVGCEISNREIEKQSDLFGESKEEDQLEEHSKLAGIEYDPESFQHEAAVECLDASSALRNKNHSITSADLLSVASGTGTKRKSKTLTKPIHYKGEILYVLEWEDTKCTIKNQEDSNLPVWLVLDEILDPMNVGAVIRSAQYFGIDKLFVVKGSSCKLSPTVSKASCGALEVMDIYQIQKFESFLQMKKDQGWNIISTVAYCEDGSEASNQITDVTDFRISRPTILILGNEGKGVSPEIQKLCDTFVSIPPENNLQEGIDSLNVSVAAGIILYSLSTGRKKTGLNYD
ncbi:rRNA methyltransferase 1 like protein [Argiope bruennichi]|uniref:rRNA methyltransferase 1 like protein n=1 Tax=Argiope bruennichi TaxID=94029 RepID=A0A8T0FX83_ARGBR|nr:rRNA methyltransferase 1 like protein [Argiope bruennichi]